MRKAGFSKLVELNGKMVPAHEKGRHTTGMLESTHTHCTMAVHPYILYRL
jgi:hypothetical protein